MERFIAIVDLETNELSTKTCDIVEVGICELDTTTGTTKKLLDVTIKEDSFTDTEKNRKAWVFKHTDLTIEKVLESEPLDKYRIKMQEIFNKYPITAFNTSFDFKILERKGFVIPKKFPCLMRTAAPHVKQNPAAWRCSFQAAWNFFVPENPYTEIHRAYDDSEHEAKVAFKLINHLKNLGIEIEEL